MSGKGGASGVGGRDRVHDFKWNQQGSRVLEQLRVLYSDGGGEGLGRGLGMDTDVILWGSDGGCVEAHKMVLGLCSPYFQKLFVQIRQSWNQRGNYGPSVVVLKGVRGSVLKHLVQFIYTGEVALPSGLMEEFLEIGNEFQIEGITYSSGSNGKKSQQFQNIVCRPTLDVNSTDNGTVEHERQLDGPGMISTPEQSGSNFNVDSYPVKIETALVDFVDESGEGDEEDPLDSFYESKLEEEEYSNDEEDQADFDIDTPTFGEKPPPKKRPKSQASTSACSSGGDKRYDWVVQAPVSDEVLRTSWRIAKRTHPGGIPAVEYQCRLGVNGSRHCTARIKSKTLNDGTVAWMNNGMPHTEHRLRGKTTVAWGMTEQQKQFALQCVQDKVLTTMQIMLKFQIKGLNPPGKRQLKAWLERLKSKNPEMFNREARTDRR